ncbi:MAG TPA: SCP2 sterol-binding domain-containing protein [Alphaproteobacteria bacterium]|nr:SCP2 sterol-binding domain-containing protein [Alphaproteobacteria bacterium]
MSLDEITKAVTERVGADSGLGASVKFAFEDEGCVLVDASKVPNEVSNEDRDADCTIRMSIEDFKSMIAGELDATMAYMTGKLKVEGDMAVAMKLSSVL